LSSLQKKLQDAHSLSVFADWKRQAFGYSRFVSCWRS
jgi:hypothetical protein